MEEAQGSSASEGAPGSRKTTSSSFAAAAELSLRVIPPPSNVSICSQLEEAIWNPQSPLEPSPEGSAEIISILQRLEVIEIESRQLLSRLLSMLQTDARLEQHIRRRLGMGDRLSQMWALVEQILDNQQGNLDFDTMLNHSEDKELKDGVGGQNNERFNVKQFDKDKPKPKPDGDQPPPATPPASTHN